MDLEQISIMEKPPMFIPEEPEQKKKGKKDKNLWEGKWDKKKINKKPTMCAILFLRNNGKAEEMTVESKKGFFSIYGKTYHEHKDCIYRLGKEGVPLAIIDEDSMMPLGTQRWYERHPNESFIDQMQRKFAELQDHVLRGIRNAELVKMGEKDKSKISGKAVVGMIILAVIGYAVLSGSGVI